MAKPKDINAYLASVPATHRAALKTIRSRVKKLYPRVTEHISYGCPLFKLDGHPLLALRASKRHSSIFPWSSSVLKKVPEGLLKDYSTGAGTVRFAPDTGIPEKLLKAVLAARAKEIKERWS